MAYLKTETPVFRRDEPVEARLEHLIQYQAQFRRELEYVLTHLGSGNMNSSGLSIGISNAAGTEVGSVGLTEDGAVGLTTSGASVLLDGSTAVVQAGGASITMNSSGIVMMFGDDGLRIIDGEISKTADGGENWTSI